jgi:hypothetical protein
MKRTIPIMIASFVGFLLIFSKISPPFQLLAEKVVVWFDIVAAFAFVLGGGNLLLNNLRKISDRQAGWGYSVITLVAFFGTLIVGIGKLGVPPNEEFLNYSWSGDYSAEGSGFWWMFNYVYVPLAATMFATLAFYISSAAFRAFRANNVEASLLLVTAVVVLVAQTSNGLIVTEWIPEDSRWAGFRIENVKDTLVNLFNTLGTRAIMIGIALGVVSTSLKVLLGVDQSYLGAD